VNAEKYSVVTTGNAILGAHNMYKGLAIGGQLRDGSPNENAVVDSTKSYIHELAGTTKFTFNGGKAIGATEVPDSMWAQFEYLATHAVSSSEGNKKVVVMTQGGTYNTFDFNNGGQGEDNGNTLVIFNTDEDITLTKTSDGRQFGPTVIAPFAKVFVKGDAGYVDGSIYAKYVETTGGNQGQLQLHGDTYKGSIECAEKEPAAKCYPIMDFDFDGEGKATKAGDLAKSMWSKWGVTISSSNSNKPAMLFDTGNPTGGDTDLADDTEGMVLIISEDGNQNDPDDNGGGGTLTFGFDTVVTIDSIGLFDLEEQGTIRMWDVSDKLVVDRDMVTMVDGEKKRMTFDQSSVSKMEIYFKGSGALTDIKFCDSPDTPVTTASSPTTTQAPPEVCTKQGFLQECTTTGQCKGMYTGADDCSNSGGGVCYCGGKVCGCEQGPESTTTAAPPTTTDDIMTTTSIPGTRGDPHFKTHTGEMYDFHGGCDLVLLDNPAFHNGLGMRVHIRTKIKTWWSYVESAVIQIGDETVEITGGQNVNQWLHINGVANGPLEEKEWNIGSVGNYVLRFKQKGKEREAHIHLGNGEKLVMKTYYGFVKVEIKAEGSTHYTGSLGLLGRFPDGKRVGRDGETLIKEVNTFGQEWQVKPEEPKLFHSYEGDWIVPAGQKCAMPVDTVEKTKLRRRRLANGIPIQQAEKACSHLESADDRKACVFDVVSTQSIDMASVW